MKNYNYANNCQDVLLKRQYVNHSKQKEAAFIKLKNQKYSITLKK